MDWGLIVSIFLMVGFGIATIILTIKLISKKKPVWAYTTKRIIGLGTGAPRDLKLFFRNRPVTNVYRTTLIFFNKGKQAVRKDDVTKSITVSFSEAKILDRPSIKPSKDEIKISAKRITSGQDSAVGLDFSYLDHNDGAIVEVLHTKYKEIKCTGNILEAGEPRYIGEFTPHHPEDFYSALTAGVLFTAALVWMWINTVSGATWTTIDWATVALITIFTAAYIYFLIYRTIAKRLFRYMQFPRWSRPSK